MSSCTCRCWPGCWATSAPKATSKTGTWARAASGFTSTRARICRENRAAGWSRPNWGGWVVGAELVEPTRLFGRGMAAIEPQWLEQVGRHLLKKQLLDPHWEKKSADVVALERAT